MVFSTKGASHMGVRASQAGDRRRRSTTGVFNVVPLVGGRAHCLYSDVVSARKPFQTPVTVFK